jgi:HPt (histidine-containing phosphotransfer) domain-containing protein
MSAPMTAVDYAHLRTQAAGDPDVMREVIQLFLMQTEQILDALEVATDAKSWKELTHTLKGSARGIGAFAVADAAARAEAAPLDTGNLSALHEAFRAVRHHLRENPL